jgi:hypothetical protein
MENIKSAVTAVTAVTLQRFQTLEGDTTGDSTRKAVSPLRKMGESAVIAVTLQKDGQKWRHRCHPASPSGLSSSSGCFGTGAQ